MNFEQSQQLFTEAQAYIPGGVNSPVRAFQAVGDYPVFIQKGKGSKITDVDGNEYIDYISSWGPLLLGHGNELIKEAIRETLENGTTFGAPTKLEIEMAEMVVDAVPSIEMVRMVNSGTEATMSAIRLARGYTKRNKLVKFEGCYHGHADHLLIKAGSGAMTFGVPSSPGVPEAIASETLTASYNNLDSVKALFEQYPDQIAAVIVEPIAGNMGLIPPVEGFLEGLREVTEQNGALLIFDEVISGFRASYGGAQKVYNIMPDLTCLGKIIGGGLPVGAYGGKKEIMSQVAPAGPVYQAGTLSGNPLAMAAGMAALKQMQDESLYANITAKAKALVDGFQQAADEAGVSVVINHSGTLLTVFFTEEKQVTSYKEAMTCDTAKFKVFFQSMLNQGIYLPPSQFECIFLSAAHSDEDIARTIEAAKVAFTAVKNA